MSTRGILGRLAAVAGTLALAGCGDGSGGSAPIFEITNAEPGCFTLGGSFPSGFDLLPGTGDRAVVVQTFPAAVVGLAIGGEAPVPIASGAIPTLPPDSDGDGVDDATRSSQQGFFPLSPILGGVTAASADLALVSASSYEEVLFYEPASGALVSATVSNPATGGAHDADGWPFLPAPGTSALRTAVSTRTCVYPGAGAVDSLGDLVGSDGRCTAGSPSYFTTFTAGSDVAADRLFVATSNLFDPGFARFLPGSVLVFDFDGASSPPALAPSTTTPVIFTTGFNPTQVTAYTNAAGRELVLVTVTGAISAGTGAANVLTDASVDVVDAESGALVATIPLGRAGPSFDEIAVDPSRRVALLGASSQRQLYAVDLAPLEDPALYTAAAPVVLDGMHGFPDARIFTADDPFELPPREDGPDPAQCAGLTHVAANRLGSSAHATDFCDGTVSVIAMDLGGSPPVPVPRDRFRVERVLLAFAPNTPDSLTKLRTPGVVRIREGLPGLDFDGPDTFVVAGQPEGAVCALQLDTF